MALILPFLIENWQNQCHILKMSSLVKRFLKPIKSSFFIFGPRGTGKTSWTLQNYSDALMIDLLLPDTERLYESYPERLISIIEANPNQKTVVIDEIQKNPKLLEVVHHLIEKDKTLQFILTGSSARKLRMKGVNLLAGRAIERHMHPFMAAELDQQFSLKKALRSGMIPLIWEAEEPIDALKTYISLYIKEEVQIESFVRDLGAFGRFLEAISFSQGSELNLSNIARECEVKRKTVENYLKVLEDILLSFKLEVFTKKAQRLLTAHPKFYFFDCGVYQQIRPKFSLDQPETNQDAILEGLIAQHLRAWCDYSSGEHRLYYWRTATGLEIDFILYGEKGLFAIEVKNKTRINNSDGLKALHAFKKDYPSAQLILLYQGKEKMKLGDVLVLPCETFLLNLFPNSLDF